MKFHICSRALLLSLCVVLAGCGSGLTTSAGTAVSSATQLQVAAQVTPAIDGIAYASTLSASGGSAQYTWTVAAGTVPTGLQLASDTGLISGVPTSTGTSNFTVAVTDKNTPDLRASKPISITVLPRLSVAPSSLPDAIPGSAYSGTLTVTGGTAPYKWSIQSGLLPTGISMSSGVFSGTPTSTGTYNFVIAISDSGSPAQTLSSPFSISVAANSPLLITTTSFPDAQNGSAYSASLQAQGGKPAYSWSLVNGSLPKGLTLATNGIISGTPSQASSSNFTVSVSDQGSLSAVKTANFSIGVKSNTLVLSTPSLGPGTVSSSYSAALQATGGTPGYTWSVSAGSLPAGLSIGATSGTITGTPTTPGSYNLTVSVKDNSSPTQVQSASAIITIADVAKTAGTAWYVRTDGGSRYSARMTQGQCDGMSDSAYPGKGTNQHCAFNDARYLWQDGSYVTTSSATFPAWGWVGQGGDTYIIRGSIASGVSWRIGWENSASASDSKSGHYWGFSGDPYSSGMPRPYSGTASQPTRILGENYGSCHAASAKTQLHGGYGLYNVLDLSNTSYVDVECLDITDFDSCGRQGQANSCSKNIGSLSDYANSGIAWSRKSTNDTLTDVHIHGLALNGMVGPTGDGVTMDYVDMIGNASSGWNADAGDGTTGTGKLLVQHYNISWNGCSEEYPISHDLPYQDCTDDNGGGYGDGFGTATTPSSPAWNVTFDQGVTSYNTQDGLDALHLTGTGSSITVTRTLAYGNMGQQIKVGGASGTASNNMIMTSCNALRQQIHGTPSGYNSNLSDYCRAADSGIKLSVGANSTLVFDNNTIYSAAATAIDIGCDGTNGDCDSTTKIDFRNNIFVGFLNNKTNGYPSGGTGDYSNPIYNELSIDFFGNAGSLYSNNITFHAKSNWTCPAKHEQNALCIDPGLNDETWHNYGYANMAPLASSAALRTGVTIGAVALDYAGITRGTPPTIGALER